jgi:hypothetical protein
MVLRAGSGGDGEMNRPGMRWFRRVDNMDNSDDANRSNALPESKMTSSEDIYRPSTLRQIFWGGVGGIIIAGILSVPFTLLQRLLIYPPSDVWSWLFSLGGVLTSAILGVVLLVMLRPVLRKTAGLRTDTRGSQTKASQTGKP